MSTSNLRLALRKRKRQSSADGMKDGCESNWASEASPTLGCSIEISRDIYIYVVGMSEYVCRMSN